VEAPKVEAPAVAMPKVEAPKAEPPKAEIPTPVAAPAPTAPLPTPQMEIAKVTPPAPTVPPAVVEDPSIKIVTKEGWVRPATGLFKKPGTHQLMSTDKPLAMVLSFLSSTTVNLDQYEGKHVRITGGEHWQKGWNQPLVRVNQVELK
jgi:hypothetical protein